MRWPVAVHMTPPAALRSVTAGPAVRAGGKLQTPAAEGMDYRGLHPLMPCQPLAGRSVASPQRSWTSRWREQCGRGRLYRGYANYIHTLSSRKLLLTQPHPHTVDFFSHHMTAGGERAGEITALGEDTDTPRNFVTPSRST